MTPNYRNRFNKTQGWILVALLFLISVMACGGGGPSSESTDTGAATEGALVFRAEWPSSDPSTGDIHAATPLEGEDVCATYGIETIRAHVLGYGGYPVGSRSWPCDTPDHTGTIDKILPGTQYQVVIEGVVAGATTATWRGQVDGISIVAGQTHDCGRITMVNVEPRFTITASAGSCGSIAPVGDIQVAEGADFTFEISASDGCHILDVVVDESSVGPMDRYTFRNIVADHTIEASFQVNGVDVDHVINASSSAGGTISPNGIILVAHNTDRTFTLQADSGYQIADLLVDGGSVGIPTDYTFTGISNDHTIRAIFRAVRYVDGSAAVSGNGTSWGQAFRTIPEAIAAAVADGADEIWVKAGGYQHNGSLEIDAPVVLYGGFVGTETQRGQRNAADNTTRIDADNVQQGVVITADATLDGFYIENGGASMGIVVGEGGGIYLPRDADVSATIANCVIRNNRAEDGAGIFVGDHNTLLLKGCTIERNTASGVGGGINLAQESNTTIEDCLIANNDAGIMGGGTFNNFNAVTIANTVFLYNSAGNTGGGVMNYDWATAFITNCTFYGNTPLTGGSAIYNSGASPTVSNSIFWHDAYNPGDQMIGNSTGSHPSVSYCNVRGGYPGIGNIDTDPLFVERDYDQNLRLKFGSPCIDTGSNIAPAIPPKDADGAQRIADGDGNGTATVDMGAYEYQPN